MDTSTNITVQIKDDYLAYSMAVLIGRAIPSLTDGLKPAQRRVLTAMKWLGLKPDGKYMKSAGSRVRPWVSYTHTEASMGSW